MGVRDIVEAGRIAYINFGEDYGKMVIIVDMVDMNRVLVDGAGNFPRVIYPLKRLTLTKLRLNILRGARTGTLKKVAKTFGLEEKWSNNAAAQKLARYSARSATTDFDRFKVMIQRKQRNYAVRKLAYKIRQ